MQTGGLDELPFPVIVKPNFEGSSKGIGQDSVVEDPIALGRVLDELLANYPDGALVERYLPGIDVRVVHVEGLPPLPAVETVVDPALPAPPRRARLPARQRRHAHGPAPRARAPVAGDATSACAISPAARSRPSRCATSPRSTSASAPTARSGSSARRRSRASTHDGALFAATRAVGLDYDATVLAVLRSAAVRHGLTALLDATKPRPARARRTSLRVGLAFNMKRIDSHAGDDREAEYDAPETIQAITQAIESHGHVVVPLEATPDFPRALTASNVDVVFNIAEGMAGRSREAQVPSLCELLGVPYTGSDSATLSICLDKGLAKRLLVEVDTPAFQVLVTGREKLRPLQLPGDREAQPGGYEQGDHRQERMRRRGPAARGRARAHRSLRAARAGRGVRVRAAS